MHICLRLIKTLLVCICVLMSVQVVSVCAHTRVFKAEVWPSACARWPVVLI